MKLKDHKFQKIDAYYGMISLCSPFVLWWLLTGSNFIEMNCINIPELFAGCFTFSSALLLWITLSKQRISSEKQSVENHFYKMLEIVRDNSTNIEVRGENGIVINGRAVFAEINQKFDEIYTVIDIHLKNLNIKKKIQISWLILFYGTNTNIHSVLIAEIKGLFSLDEQKTEKTKNIIIQIEEFIEPLNDALSDNKEESLKFIDKIKRLSNICKNKGDIDKTYIRCDGYQSILAHYYRHLYQVIVFINKQDNSILNYDEKYNYVKTLRAQLSIFELVLLFYNTISPYGRTWESNMMYGFVVKKNTESDSGKSSNTFDNIKEYVKKFNESKDSINDQLITKYQFFRNATMQLNDGIEIVDFYPMISYENKIYEKECITELEFNELKKKYN